jgi:cell division septal protein FtsQ
MFEYNKEIEEEEDVEEIEELKGPRNYVPREGTLPMKILAVIGLLFWDFIIILLLVSVFILFNIFWFLGLFLGKRLTILRF